MFCLQIVPDLWVLDHGPEEIPGHFHTLGRNDGSSTGKKQEPFNFRFKWQSGIQITIWILVQYSNGGLNTRLDLIRYSKGIKIKYRTIQWMRFAGSLNSLLFTIGCWYSYHHLVKGLVCRPPCENRSAIQMQQTRRSSVFRCFLFKSPHYSGYDQN